MNNSFKKFGLALLVLVTFVFIYESGKEKPVSWYESYNNKDKNPYGLYILDQEIGPVIGTDTITRFSNSLYNFLSNKNYDTLQPSTLILLTADYADLDQYTADYLKVYLEAGNTALILTASSTDPFLEVFGLKNEPYLFDFAFTPEPNTVLELTNPKLTKQKFRIKNEPYPTGLEIIDSLKNNLEILGYKTVEDTLKQVNLVRVKQGKGQLIYGTTPIIFTNYYLLKSNNHLYAESVFSYLPEKQQTYLHVASLNPSKESNSILRFVFSHAALTWAWYFFLLGLLIFALFTAKRKQRIIPLIKPLKNTTVQFTKTVANLYIQTKDYNDLMHKSIIYTLEKMRREYHIDTAVLDENFVHNYHVKTHKNKEDILAFVNMVNAFRKSTFLATQEDLVKLHQVTQKILD
ncbi:DUF4350 domain-containing protein [Myroides odoratus]|uniref:DUF4350 domain-containing protein n=1 Tax=Myroides odoratus TaxID=256 RepID=UPI0039AFCB95